MDSHIFMRLLDQAEADKLNPRLPLPPAVTVNREDNQTRATTSGLTHYRAVLMDGDSSINILYYETFCFICNLTRLSCTLCLSYFVVNQPKIWFRAEKYQILKSLWGT